MSATTRPRALMVIGTKNLTKPFSTFYCRYYDLVSKFHVGKSLSEPEFYGDFACMFKKMLALMHFQRSL